MILGYFVGTFYSQAIHTVDKSLDFAFFAQKST